MAIASPGGRTQTLSYDPVSDGLPAALTDVFGRIAQLSYDPATRNLTSLTQGSDLSASLQRTTSFSYTPEGFVNTITDAVGRVLDFDYDPMGRIDDLTLPDLRVIDFVYDAKGNLTSIQPPSRPLHGFAYDERDREERRRPSVAPWPRPSSTTGRIS